MFKYLPVTEPEDLAIFERFTRRCFRAGIAMIVITGMLLVAVPSRQMNLFGLQLAFLIIAFVALSATTRPLKFKQDYKRLGFSPYTKPALPFPLSLRYLISPLLLWIAFPAMMFGMSSSKMTALAVGFAYALALIGWPLAFHGLRARNPSPPCCTKCCYPIDPESLPAECPECGKAASNINQLTRTPIVKRPVLVAWGVPMFLIGNLLFVTIIFKPSGMFAVMPRPALLAAAAIDERAFRTLDTTKLSQTEHDRLVGRILDAVENESIYLMSDQTDWLGEQLIAGTLREDHAERFVMGSDSFRIISRGSTGSIELSIMTDEPGVHVQSISTVMFMGGFKLCTPNDESETTQYLGRSTSAWGGPGLASSFEDRDEFDAQFPDLPESSTRLSVFTKAQSGTSVEVRFVTAVYDRASYLAGGQKPSIQWNDDGTYSITPEPLIWFERSITGQIRD